MTDSQQIIPTSNINIGISPEIITKLKTYDDYVNFYIQLDEVSSGFSWMKADTLLKMEENIGEKSLKQFSNEVKQPLSTITNYIRVAKAFPKEKRNPAASFSLHFQASFADSYDEEKKDFQSEKRFDWLDKAMDENMSTRRLLREIQTEKETVGLNETEREEKSRIRNIYKEITSAINAIYQKAENGSISEIDKLIKIKEFIHG